MTWVRRLVGLAAGFALTACQGGPNAVMPSSAPSSTASSRLARPHWTKTSVGKFVDPYGVAVAADGMLYVADPGDKSIWKISSEGRKKLLAPLPAVAGPKFDPVGIGVAANGSVVYVADKGTGHIWGVKSDNSIVKVAGAYPWPLYPRGVAFSGSTGTIYADIATASPGSTKGSVRCLSAMCPALTVREFDNPYGAAADDRGNVYVADAGAKQVFRADASGLTSIGRFVDPYGVAVTPDGAHVYVADAGAKKVFAGTPDGSWSEIGTFGDPYGVAAAADGTVYVADPGTKDVWKLQP